jgi:plastocyanin
LRGTVRRGWCAIVVMALALTACGSGGGGSSGASSAPPSATSIPSATSSSDCRGRAGLTGQVTDHGTQQASGTTIDLEAGDFFFDPTCVVIGSSGTLTVTVANDGQALHNLSITSLGIDQDVAPGQAISVQVSFDVTAPLPFFCKYHVASGMQGAFVPA